MQRRYVLLADDSFINYFSNVIRGSVWILLSLVAVIWPITVYSTWRRSVFHYLMKSSRKLHTLLDAEFGSVRNVNCFLRCWYSEIPCSAVWNVGKVLQKAISPQHLFIIKHIHGQYMNLDNAAKRKKLNTHDWTVTRITLCMGASEFSCYHRLQQ